MLRHISADYIMPVSSMPVKNGIVSVNDRGEIVSLHDQEASLNFSGPVERYDGVIVPGFINCHCHLELSHLLGHIPGGNGLIPFLSSVIAGRSAKEEVILEAMSEADKQMQENGIVAVADISNNSLSRDIKSASPLYYHTFVEFLGIDPAKADTIFEQALKTLREFAPLPASLAPHAPYSVSKSLLKRLQKNKEGKYRLTTMHNQESEDENELFRYKTGGFIDFYKSLNQDLEFFRPQARNSIQSLMPLFAAQQKILLVHNINTGLKDVYFAHRFNRQIHWCFCPNANLYIGNKLPRIGMFTNHDFNLTVGTDSLASNSKLCILSELKVIRENFPALSFAEILSWGTLNGARFLEIDQDYGSIESGKRPGLNLLDNMDGLELTPDTTVRKLI